MLVSKTNAHLQPRLDPSPCTFSQRIAASNSCPRQTLCIHSRGQMIGLRDPLLQHIQQTNTILNVPFHKDASSKGKLPSTTPTFGFDAMMKADATLLRDYSISANHMKNLEQKKRFERKIQESEKKTWDIKVPDDFNDLLPQQEKFHVTFGSATFAKQRRDEYKKELRLREMYNELGQLQIERRVRKKRLENRDFVVRTSDPSKKASFDAGPFQSSADQKLQLQLEAGRISRWLWKENPSDRQTIEIHPDVKPGTFLRNICGSWGSKCLDVENKPLPKEVRSKYHATKSNGREMLPRALDEVFKLRGKPAKSTHDLRIKQANDRVDIFGSAPSKVVQFRSDSPKSWHSKVNSVRKKRQRPKSSPAYHRARSSMENEQNLYNRFGGTVRAKKRPITANAYRTTRYEDAEGPSLLALVNSRSDRRAEERGKRRSRRPKSAVTRSTKGAKEANSKILRRRRKHRPETAN